MHGVMKRPWADGPNELIQHAVDHLATGGDFDRRIAMISVDNAVELTVKTSLGLPERARGYKGPSRKDLEQASESFPALLSLLETHASHLITGLSLEEIEWYHRLRNQLYHSGNGITVDAKKVETYLELSIGLFQSLFGFAPSLQRSAVIHTKTGLFLQLWTRFDLGMRKQLPPKNDFAYHWKRNYLASVDKEAVPLYDAVLAFRNNLVHGFADPQASDIDDKIAELKRLANLLQIDFDGESD